MGTNGNPFTGPIENAAAAEAVGEEYKAAVSKIITSHTINELYGARVFDEPAIALAPNPYEKWLTCRIAMEEYGHHVRFRRLADDLGIAAEKLDAGSGRHLSIFEYPLESWPDFLAIKALADLAEILQIEDLLECSYTPLKVVARETMPEEKFHAGFGRNRLDELRATPEGKQRAQHSINRYFPVMLPFFGRRDSRNNAMFRRWGVKQRTNGFMRGDYIARVREMTAALGLEMPPIPDEFAPDLAEFEAAS